MFQNEHLDTLTFEIRQSWKFDLSFDLWPLRKNQTMGSPLTLLITVPRRTIWHLNFWNRMKLKIWPFFWPLTPRKGWTMGSPLTLLIAIPRRTSWHLNLWNRTKLKIWPSYKPFSWPLTPKEGSGDGSPLTLLIAGPRRTIWHLKRWNRTKLKTWPFLFDLCDPIWPHTFLSPHNFCRQCQDNSCPQIAGQYLFRENQVFDSVTLTWPFRGQVT